MTVHPRKTAQATSSLNVFSATNPFLGHQVWVGTLKPIAMRSLLSVFSAKKCFPGCPVWRGMKILIQMKNHSNAKYVGGVLYRIQIWKSMKELTQVKNHSHVIIVQEASKSTLQDAHRREAIQMSAVWEVFFNEKKCHSAHSNTHWWKTNHLWSVREEIPSPAHTM